MQLDFFSWWWAGVPWSRCLHIETYSRPLIVQALKNFWWFFGCQFYVCSFGSYVGMFDVAERMTKICQVNSTEARVTISFKLKSISKVLAWIARTGIIAERWHMLFLIFASNFCFLNWNQKIAVFRRNDFWLSWGTSLECIWLYDTAAWAPVNTVWNTLHQLS